MSNRQFGFCWRSEADVELGQRQEQCAADHRCGTGICPLEGEFSALRDIQCARMFAPQVSIIGPAREPRG